MGAPWGLCVTGVIVASCEATQAEITIENSSHLALADFSTATAEGITIRN